MAMSSLTYIYCGLFCEIFLSANSSHLEWRVELSDTSLKWDYPRIIPARLGLIWFSGFTGKDLNVIFYQNPLKPPNQITLNLAGMVLGWVPFKIVSRQPHPPFKMEGTHPRTIPARFSVIWFSGFRGDLNVIFYQNMPNLHNRYISAERKISKAAMNNQNFIPPFFYFYHI
jgi:hypothetical protein